VYGISAFIFERAAIVVATTLSFVCGPLEGLAAAAPSGAAPGPPLLLVVLLVVTLLLLLELLELLELLLDVGPAGASPTWIEAPLASRHSLLSVIESFSCRPLAISVCKRSVGVGVGVRARAGVGVSETSPNRPHT
jgi:hypothetical protein